VKTAHIDQAALDQVDFALDAMPGQRLHDVLHAYRARGPVQPTRFLTIPSFVITEHAALLEAFKDVARFPPHLMYQATIEKAAGKTFISMEDPQHLLFRKLATPAFRSRAVASDEETGLRELALELVEKIDASREFDLMPSFVSRFPYLVITRLLGLPRDREDEFHEWALQMLQIGQAPDAAARAGEELTSFLAPVVEARRQAPRNDVISELLAANVEGRALTNEEIYSHVRLLFPTGGETTHGSLGNLLYALLSHEGSWRRVGNDRSLIPGAVDEGLRWETSIAVLPRLSCGKDIEFCGTDIPANSWVLFAIAGANHDPAVFGNPDIFDIDRSAQDALTFGRGVKACPGMHLTRRNMSVALDVLLDRFPTLTLVAPDTAIPERSTLRCPTRLRVSA
jgi:cytochrome P450